VVFSVLDGTTGAWDCRGSYITMMEEVDVWKEIDKPPLWREGVEVGMARN
jgi:hypothetical protein